MELPFSDSEFISTYLTHPLRFSISQLSDVLHKAPIACVLKDASTRKYLLANNFITEIAGLAPDQITGLTASDLPYSFYHGGKKACINTTQKIDDNVILNNAADYYRERILTYQGFIVLRHEIKIPVIGQSNRVVAILTYDIDLTLREKPFELFKLYRQHYKPQEAMEKFLGYFKIDTCFQEMPSEAEMYTFLAMLCDPHHKEVARLLNRSHRTIAHHTWALGDKLQEGMSLAQVLGRMRSNWISIPAHSLGLH